MSEGVRIPRTSGPRLERTLQPLTPADERLIATLAEGWTERFNRAVQAANNPDRCWRCDAARGETDVGLCPTCHADLTAS